MTKKGRRMNGLSIQVVQIICVLIGTSLPLINLLKVELCWWATMINAKLLERDQFKLRCTMVSSELCLKWGMSLIWRRIWSDTLEDEGWKYAGEESYENQQRCPDSNERQEDWKFICVAGSTVRLRVVSPSSSLSNLDTTKFWVSEHYLCWVRRAFCVVNMQGWWSYVQHCVLEKQKRASFGTTVHRTKGTLDYIHSDLLGTLTNSFQRWCGGR